MKIILCSTYRGLALISPFCSVHITRTNNNSQGEQMGARLLLVVPFVLSLLLTALVHKMHPLVSGLPLQKQCGM